MLPSAHTAVRSVLSTAVSIYYDFLMIQTAEHCLSSAMSPAHTAATFTGDSDLLLSDKERAQQSSMTGLEIQDSALRSGKRQPKGRFRRCCSSMIFLQGVPCTSEIYGIGLGEPSQLSTVYVCSLLLYRTIRA